MKKDTETKQKHQSLAEYCWEHRKIIDLPMQMAELMKAEAWKDPEHKVRAKKDLKTPLLTPRGWDPIWEKFHL